MDFFNQIWICAVRPFLHMLWRDFYKHLVKQCQRYICLNFCVMQQLFKRGHVGKLCKHPTSQIWPMSTKTAYMKLVYGINNSTKIRVSPFMREYAIKNLTS